MHKNICHSLNYDLKMSEMPTLDNLYFESHLEMTGLDLCWSGVNVMTDKVNDWRKLDSCTVLSTVKWLVQAGIFISLQIS